MVSFKSVARKNLLVCMLCVGVLQIAGYYLAATLAHPTGGVAVPQPDTLLYCQAARRIAEGAPFSFAQGSAVCTGTTSVLYPFVLALPNALGMVGDGLLLAGFWLNAVFYLLFLFGWGIALWEWLESGLARCVAAALIALGGQAAFCALAQSDIGFWMAASGGLAAGLALRKPAVYGPLLILGPWIRPEGMVCVIAFSAIWGLAPFVRRSTFGKGDSVKDGLIVAIGILSMLGVFALNFALTGQCQFSSVANKGYFSNQPFAAAVVMTFGDLLRIAKCYLFGLVPAASARDLVAVPILSAAFIWLGVFCGPWRTWRDKGLLVMVLAAFGGMLTVAQSGWQDTNFDRYLVWTVPLVLLFLSEGTAVATRWLKARGAVPWLPPALCVLYAGCAAFVALCSFGRASKNTDLLRQFAVEMDAKLPKESSVGAFGACGVAYRLGHRPFRHLWGIYSPEFQTKGGGVAALEILKDNPEARFDYWFLTPEHVSAIFGEHAKDCCGETVLTGPNGYEVRRADWRIFDYSAQPHAVGKPPGQLVCRVDVGNELDEKQADYEVIDRYGRRPEEPTLIFGKLAGTFAFDCGRLLVGGDELTVPLHPDKDVRVVMRTYPKWKSTRTDSGTRSTSDYVFANPLKMNVTVDGEVVQEVSVSYATNDFSDVSFQIPGTAIRKTPCRVGFLGDHVACAYWFYQ